MTTAMNKLRVFADGTLIVANVSAATRFTQRLCGLLRHPALARGEGLLLEPGGSVHTLGMSFSIDVVFIDRQRFVLGTRAHVPPNRACWAPRRTHATMELWSGACADTGLRAGQHLIFAAKSDASAE